MRGPQIILQTHDMILQILFIKYINYSFIYRTSSVGENRNEQNMNVYVDLSRFMTKYKKISSRTDLSYWKIQKILNSQVNRYTE